MDNVIKKRVNISISPAVHRKAKDDSKKLFGGIENVSAYIEYLILMAKPKK